MGYTTLKFDPQQAQCHCHACIEKHNLRGPCGRRLSNERMVLCSTCGCKRCPHASNHELACTGSNKPGQPGSVYGTSR